MKWIDYREKLGIGFNDEQKRKALTNNIFAFIERGEVNQNYSYNDYWQFCQMTGEFCEEFIFPANQYIARVFQRAGLSIREAVSYYIAFVNTQIDKSKEHRRNLIDILSKFMDNFNVQHEVLEDNEGYFVFPKGVPEFDSELVSQPLVWLREYPKAENAWSKALRSYAEANDDNASDIADKFRKALETFFQDFFGGNKSLENYKSEYGNYLKQKNIPKEISGNLETVLQLYTNYMNSYAKHRDRTSDILLEYLMYQTGNIIRLLIILKQEGTPNAN